MKEEDWTELPAIREGLKRDALQHLMGLTPQEIHEVSQEALKRVLRQEKAA